MSDVKMEKKIGILGGMGPSATARFYSDIIKTMQKKYNAVQDTEFPPMVIYSCPLEGFDEAGIVDEKRVEQQLKEGIKLLNAAGADMIVMPCNTVHEYIQELRMISKVKIISIIEETVKRIKIDKIKKIGVICSETTYKLDLYGKKLRKEGIAIIVPTKSEKEAITELVEEIMGGNVQQKSKSKVLKIMETMRKNGAEAILIGCTELPLVIDETNTEIKLYNSLQILVEETVGEWKNGSIAGNKK